MLDFILCCATLIYLAFAIHKYLQSKGGRFPLDRRRPSTLKYFHTLMGAVMHWPEEWIAAGVALGTTTIAALVALTLSTAFGIQSPYLVFLLAVVVADMSAGGFAGISASLLSVFFTWFFFMPPVWSFALPSLSDGLTIALLLIVALLLGHFWHGQRRMIDDLTAENFSLRSRLQKLGRSESR